jgi:lon-related putative ATP-dependent protease
MAGRGKKTTVRRIKAKKTDPGKRSESKKKPRELTADEFCPCCDPALFPFETTAEVATNDEIVGQDRAVKSLEFGLAIGDKGYNIYAAGISGTGKSSIINRLVRKTAQGQPVPDDWVYVNNFREPDRANAIRLPSGKGRELQKKMEKLIEDLKDQIPKVFESKSYEEQKSQFLDTFQEKRGEVLMKLDREAEELGLTIKSTPAGLITLPLKDGKPMEPQEYEVLPDAEKEKIRKSQEVVNGKIRNTLREIKEIEKQTREKVERLNREVASFVLGPFIEELGEHFKDVPEVPEYLRDAKADILENVGEFFKEGAEKEGGMQAITGTTFFNRYRINLVVDNSQTEGAPVIYETNPTYTNLIGYVERKVLLGAMYTDFSLIREGALLRANGGYLIANAIDVLRSPFSWDALKRTMRNSEVRIEDISDQMGFHTAGGMHPEPIPVKVKVVLIGNTMVYNLLHSLDEEFRKIFKVKADFSQIMDRDVENTLQLGAFVGRLCKEEGLLPFTREAVAGIVDHSSRLVEDRDKLTLRLGDIADLVREASFWAKEAGKKRVAAAHVEKAMNEKIYRSGMLEERVQELITEGTIMVDVKGKIVGQINGLAIYDLGDFAFGKPARITAQVFTGRGGVVNIERRARLSGRTHDKGVMILSGYLGGKYGRKRPLTLSASITFEQSYEEIDGDSASSTELYAIMSGIADLPIDQGIAVTGSVNQHGEIQPVGGINRKIEGFFDVCRAMGLTGMQGVIIPKQNVKHLVLRKDVIGAVKEGKFHLYPVGTVDEGIEILTGVKAGEMGKDGSYPDSSVHGRIMAKLAKMGREGRGRRRRGTRTRA